MSTAATTDAAALLGGPGPSPTSSPTPAPASDAARNYVPPDKLGRKFDAKKFLTDASGAPRLDKLGRFIPQGLGAKKGGKKGAKTQRGEFRVGVEGVVPAEASQIVAPAAPAAAPVPQGPDKYALAAGSVTAMVQAGLIALGQEEGILTDAEKIAVGEPVEAVLRKYGLGEMPPELSLAVALAAVVAPRMAKPKTQTSVQKIKAWAVEKWFAFKGERVARRIAADQQEAPARA